MLKKGNSIQTPDISLSAHKLTVSINVSIIRIISLFTSRISNYINSDHCINNSISNYLTIRSSKKWTIEACLMYNKIHNIRKNIFSDQINNNSKRKIPLMSSPEHNFSSYDDCQLNALFLAVQHSSWPLQPDRFI